MNLPRSVLAAMGLLALTSCRGRPRSWDLPVDGERPTPGGASVLEFDLSSGAPETSPKGLLRVPSRNTFDALVAALHQASTRKELKGVFVTFGVAPLGWARAHELGEALAVLQKKVPVLCHADAWDNATYAAAARGCGTTTADPSLTLATTINSDRPTTSASSYGIRSHAPARPTHPPTATTKAQSTKLFFAMRHPFLRQQTPTPATSS